MLDILNENIVEDYVSSLSVSKDNRFRACALLSALEAYAEFLYRKPSLTKPDTSKIVQEVVGIAKKFYEVSSYTTLDVSEILLKKLESRFFLDPNVYSEIAVESFISHSDNLLKETKVLKAQEDLGEERSVNPRVVSEYYLVKTLKELDGYVPKQFVSLINL